MNVEVFTTVKAIKCIHKYIYRGSDQTTVQIDRFQDEIAQHLNGRYIRPTRLSGRYRNIQLTKIFHLYINSKYIYQITNLSILRQIWSIQSYIND